MTTTDTQASQLSGSDVFRLVWRGWFAGVLSIFVPIWAIAVIVVVVSRSWEELAPAVVGLILLPIIAAMQGIIVGGVVTLGQVVWRRKSARAAD